MANALHRLDGRIICPDDGATLKLEGDRFRCSECTRDPMVEDQILDLVPKTPADLSDLHVSETYVQNYEREVTNTSSNTWGEPEKNPKSWVARRQRQVEFALPLVLNGQPGDSMVLADFAGGAGYHTLRYAQFFGLVIHCDLSMANLVFARNKAKELGIENIVFVRADYLRPPFVGGLERIICFATLMYGPAHEKQLLANIYSALSPNGVAVVDFHNWWHNPLRRLGLLRQNVPSKGSHSKRFVMSLLNDLGISEYEYFPFYREFSNDHPLTKLLSFSVQPMRLTYRIRKPA